MGKQQDPQAQIDQDKSAPLTFDIPDANIIIQSSNLVNF